MILRLSSAILLATAVALGTVVVLWIRLMVRDGMLRRRPRRNAIYRCESCGHVYDDARNVPLSACRRCGALNEAVRR